MAAAVVCSTIGLTSDVDANGLGGTGSVDTAAATAELTSIFDSLYQAIGIARTKPRLKVRPDSDTSRQRVAWFDPIDPAVTIDERVYRLAHARFGDKSRDALAVIVGHELAHYYWQHGWVAEFGSQFDDLEIGKRAWAVAKDEEIGFLEAQADYSGGFFAYLAGFNIKAVASPFYEGIYSDYKLSDSELGQYPKLAERQRIVTGAIEKLQDHILFFEAAVRLLLVGSYQKAQRAFDFIGTSFYSREILNNAGVARALDAVGRVALNRTTRFAYPFEFDASTRLGQLQTLGFAGDPEVERLLNEARDLFLKAILSDPNYPTAYVNLACVYDLQEERQLALGYARKAVEIAEHEKEVLTAANAHIALGIAYAHSDRPDAERQILARAEFEAARGANPVVAASNASILEAGEKWALRGIPKEALEGLHGGQGQEIVNPGAGLEQIGGVNPAEREMDFLRQQPPAKEVLLPRGAGSPPLLIRSKVLRGQGGAAQLDALSLVIGNRRTNFVTAASAYSGVSARGIRIGSSLGEVKGAYGAAPIVLSARQGTYHVYPRARVIFEFDHVGQVRAWTVFHADAED